LFVSLCFVGALWKQGPIKGDVLRVILRRQGSFGSNSRSLEVLRRQKKFLGVFGASRSCARSYEGICAPMQLMLKSEVAENYAPAKYDNASMQCLLRGFPITFHFFCT